MTTEELRDLLTIHGHLSRVKGNEVALQICVFCGNPKYNCELNAVRGVYHCWACGARGTVQRFLRDQLKVDRVVPVNVEMTAIAKLGSILSPEDTKPIESGWAWDYLRHRDMGEVDAELYGIRQGVGDKWEGRLVFPLLEYWTQRQVADLGRAALPGIRPKYYAQWEGKKTITGFHSRSDTHVMVEGVFDGIAVHRGGFNAAVLGGVEEVAVEEWASRVPQHHHVVIMLDGDAFEQAKRMYWRVLPIHLNTRVIPLPLSFDPAMLAPEVIQTLIKRSSASLLDAVEKARGGPPPVPLRGFA